MQVTEHAPIRGALIRELASRCDRVIYLRENAQAPVYPPPCECPDCENSFYTNEEQGMDRYCYTKQISEVEADEIVRELIMQAQRDREFLLKQCEAHGDRIMSRWRKRSRDKRESWLLQAEPDLYKDRWFLPRYTYLDPHWRDTRKYRKSFLLPYMSVELLKTDPSIFLSLLHNRTRYPPQDWAAFDSKELLMGWALGSYDLEFCDACVVMHGARYGELTSWEPESAHRSDIIGFPRARLILEAQACLLGFLRNVVNQVLEGADLESPMGSTKWVETTRTGFKKSGDVAFWSQYTYQPFSHPPRFDIEALMSQAKARMDVAADHLWLLQTEPSYMRRYTRLIHENEAVKRAEDDEGYQMMFLELCHDISVLWFWQCVYDEFENAKIWHDRYKDHIAAGQPLPPKYDQALGALEIFLVNAMHNRSKHLQAIIPQRPGFRHLWKIERTPIGQIQLQRKSKVGVKQLLRDDPLDWCLLQLQGAPDEQRRFDYAMLFDFLDEHLASCSARDRARLDEILFAKLSDYAAISELFLAVRLNRPQNTNRTIEDVEKHDNRKAWRHFDQMPTPSFEEQHATVAPLEKFLNLSPPSGRKDRNWLQRFDAGHEALQEFWRSVRGLYQKILSRAKLTPTDIKEDLEILSIHSSLEYLDAVKNERKDIIEDIERLQRQANSVSFQPKAASMESAEREKHQNQQKKIKLKTRPPKPISENTVPSSEISDVLEGGQTIIVKQQTFNVLTAMFPASCEKASKSIDWDTFVGAMADVGFSARHNGGSAVVFEKEKRETSLPGGRIIFHKPHPVSKIDPVMFHSMGKRMGKWFGWYRDLFVLESRSEAL